MPVSPEHSKFTACVLGEAPAADQAVFNKAVMSDASLREEALALSRTAHRLSEALRQEPLVYLTLPQRHAVLEPGSTIGTGAAPPSTRLLQGISGAATSRLRKPARTTRSWLTPTLTTGAVAAALGVGLFVLPGLGGKNPSAAGKNSGIPAVAIQPSVPGKTVQPPRPTPPPAATAAGKKTELPVPEGVSPESPARFLSSPSMAAHPPTIVVIPDEPAPAWGSSASEPAGVRHPATAPHASDGLAAPAPPKP